MGRICYDCKAEIPFAEDVVMERRQTAGGGHGDRTVYPGDFTNEPVHRDRRICQENKKRRAIKDTEDWVERAQGRLKAAHDDLTHAEERLRAQREGKCLHDFPDGARVVKTTAIRFDFAYGRTGTVHREVVEGKRCVGVLWDGENRIFEYSEDCGGFTGRVPEFAGESEGK